MTRSSRTADRHLARCDGREGRTTKQGRRSELLGWALATPTLLWVGGTLIFALVLLINVSLRDVRLATLERLFTAPLSIANYVEVLGDGATWRSFWTSFIYVLGSTALPFAIGLGMALLLNKSMPMQRLMRTLALLPWAVPGVTATVAFMWMMSPTYGVLNYFLRSLGLIDGDVDWFGSQSTALLAVILPTSWKATPFFTLMLLAGLQSIPKELYEASAVDGASKVAQFRSVTLPGLARFVFISVIFQAMYTFREFDFIYASTQGGPAGATETTAVRVFNLAFDGFDFGTASALGVITFVVVATIVWLLVRKQYSGALEGIW